MANFPIAQISKTLLAAASIATLCTASVMAGGITRPAASKYCVKATVIKFPKVGNIFHDDEASDFYYSCLGSVWAHGVPKDKNDPRDFNLLNLQK
jgi:hypothetical protein